MHVLRLTRPSAAGVDRFCILLLFPPVYAQTGLLWHSKRATHRLFTSKKYTITKNVSVFNFSSVPPQLHSTVSCTVSSAAALEMLTVFSSFIVLEDEENGTDKYASCFDTTREGNEFLPPGTGIRNKRRRVFRGNVSGFLGAIKLHSHTHLSLNPPPPRRCKKICIIKHFMGAAQRRSMCLLINTRCDSRESIPFFTRESPLSSAPDTLIHRWMILDSIYTNTATESDSTRLSEFSPDRSDVKCCPTVWCFYRINFQKKTFLELFSTFFSNDFFGIKAFSGIMRENKFGVVNLLHGGNSTNVLGFVTLWQQSVWRTLGPLRGW